MGRVLAAFDHGLDRDVALKVLLPGANADRFVRESKITARLPHPGIPPVYALGTLADGSPFLAMKLVAGRTLAAEMKAADRPRLLQAFTQVCQAVGFAHSKGIIHRDLKPSNIMVGAFGEVQVMDWGLAKDLARGEAADEPCSSPALPIPGAGSDPNQTTDHRAARESTDEGTQAGTILGTPAYMAPEQARGEAADARADVFALGGLLCALLTGQPPYSGTSALEIIRRAGAADLAEAYARLDGCGADAELVALCRCCLSPDPSDRPADGQSLADGLTAYFDGVQERLHQAELAHAVEVARTEEAQATAAQERKAREAAQARAVAERQARRLTLALAGTVLLAVTLGGGGWLWVKAERAGRLAQVNSEIHDALNKATAFREQAQTATVGSGLLFAQAREQAQRALALVENGPADDSLKKQVQQLQTELNEEEKDRRLVTALDEARLLQAETLSENRFAWEQAMPKFREAFQAYGLPAGEGEPAAAAERIRQRPTAVRAAIVATLDAWDGLANNKDLGITESHRKWLRSVLEAAEPEDGWGRRMRAARAEKDPVQRQAALKALAASAIEAKAPAQTLTKLAEALRPPEAAKLLREAQRRYPADFWVNQNLGDVLQRVTPPERDEAVRFLTAAVALRPESPGVHLNLGFALTHKGQVDEAFACYQKAIELDPKYAAAHSSLGAALREKGQVDAAIASHRTAIALDPKLAGAHHNLGTALRRKGQVEEAIASFRTAIALDPKLAAAHTNLGMILCDVKRDYDGAITCFRKVLDLDPKDVHAHYNLGNALRGKGQVEEAIASFRQAVALDPQHAEAHCNLGHALGTQGRFAESLAAHRRGHEVGSKKPGWAYNSAAWVRQAESLAALEDRLPAFLKGQDQPRDAAERLGLIRVCRAKKFSAAAARLSADAFAADPKLAENLRAGHRYNAACSASLAAAGQGEDAAKPDDEERSRLRKQALDWLRADLTLRARQLETGKPADRDAVQQALRYWQKDPDLAGIRDAAALAKLPAEERAACEKLWADAAALLEKAGTPATGEGEP